MHRLIERLGLRRQQLFAAQADVVERLRAWPGSASWPPPTCAARRRRRRASSPATIAAVADSGLREQEEPELAERGRRPCQVLALRGRRRARGRPRVRARAARRALPAAGDRSEPIPDALLREPLPPDGEPTARAGAAPGAVRGDDARAPAAGARLRRRRRRGAGAAAVAVRGGGASARSGPSGRTREEELFGPAETLHSTYRLLRDELLEGTMRAGGRLGELRFDTDLDVSHAVVRYLELLKLAALIARPRAGRASPRRCATSTPGSARRSPPSSARSSTSSPLDD